MTNIFISYRREDSGGHSGRLCDRLTERFGDAKVFMDLQDIAPGQNFAQSIEDRIATCDVVIAVIGPRWLDMIRNRTGSEDFVQHEISAALNRGIKVIPVLVGGARMPAAVDLPSAMSALRHLNAFEIRDERFDEDVALLCEAVGQGRPRAGRKTLLVGASSIVAASAAVYLLVMRPASTTPPESIPAAIAVPDPAPPALEGDWLAEMQKEGQPPFRIRLTFVVTGDNIAGMVRYPTGDAPILDARLTGSSLTFHTSHVPQFESTPAIIRFQAAVGSGEITFTTTDDYGIARGVAKRRPPDPQ